MKSTTIELKPPYSGEGIVDEHWLNIKMDKSNPVNRYMSYTRYLYDVSTGSRHTDAEFDAYLRYQALPTPHVNPFSPMHEKIAYRASNELTLEEKRELFVNGL
jgi:hypothetical protein